MIPLLLLLSLAVTEPDPALLSGLEYRQLHFPRGGRSTAVTGVAADPFTFYFGGIGVEVDRRRHELAQRVGSLLRGRIGRRDRGVRLPSERRVRRHRHRMPAHQRLARRR